MYKKKKGLIKAVIIAVTTVLGFVVGGNTKTIVNAVGDVATEVVNVYQ